MTRNSKVSELAEQIQELHEEADDDVPPLGAVLKGEIELEGEGDE